MGGMETERERKRETGRRWNSVWLEEVNIVLMTKMRTEMGRREMEGVEDKKEG